MKEKIKKYWKSIVAVVVISTALLFLPVQKIFRDYTGNILRTMLTELVEKETKGKYGFDYEDLRFNIFKQRIRLNNFTFFLKDSNLLVYDTNSVTNKVFYNVSVESLEIELIDQIDFFFNNKLGISMVEINKPNVSVVNNRIKKRKLSISKMSGDLYQGVTQYLEVLELENLKVNEAKMNYTVCTNEFKKVYSFNEFSFKVHDFKLDKDRNTPKNNKLLFTDNFDLSSGYQEFVLPDSLHKISYDRFDISMKKEFIEISNLKITPLEKDVELSKKQIEVFVPTVKLISVDFAKAYHENQIDIEKLLVERPAIKIKLNLDNKEKDSLSISQKIAKLKILKVINTIMVERLILTRSSVAIELNKKNRKRDFLVKGLNYQGAKLKIDSSTFNDFVFGDLHQHYKFNVQELKHEITEEGLMVKVENVNYSSLTKVLDVDNFLINPNSDKIQKNLSKHNKRIQLESLETGGIHLSNFTLEEISDNKSLNLTSSRIKQPKITLLYDTAFVKDTNELVKNNIDLLSSILDTLITQNFNIENALITIKDAHNPRVKFGEFQKVSFFVNKLNLNSYANKKTDLFDVMESAGISTSTSYIKIPGIPDKVSWRAMNYSSAKKNIKFHQLKYSNKNDQSNVKIHFKSVSANKFRPKEIVQDKILALGLVELNNGKIEFIESKKKIDKAKVSPLFSIDSLALNDIDFVHTIKDTVKQKVDKFSLHTGNLSFYKDSLGKKKIGLHNLDFFGKKGLFSIDQNRHYLNFNSINFSSSDSTFKSENIKIAPVIDQRNKKSKTLIRTEIDYISIEGLAINPTDAKSEFVGRKINICTPVFKMSTIQNNTEQPKSRNSFVELHKWFSNVTGINLIKYDALEIENGNVDLVSENKTNSSKNWRLSVPQYNITARDFKLDSTQSNHDKHLFYATSYNIEAYGTEQTFTDSLQNFKVGQLTYNTEKQYLKLQNADVLYMIYRKEDSSKQMLFEGNIPLLEIEGLKPIQLNEKKILNLKRVHLMKPNIDITQFHKNTDFVSRELEIDESNKDKKAIKNLILDELELVDGNITWDFRGGDISDLHFKHVGLKGKQIEMKPEAKGELPKFGQVVLSFGDFKHDVMQKYYDLQLDSFYLNSEKEVMSIEGGELIPRFGIFEFAKVAGWEKSRLELYVSKLDFEQFKVKELVYNNNLNVGLVNADSLWIRNFKNKNFPMISRFMPIPTYNLMNSKMNINIDSVQLKAGHIEHRQLAENGVKSGKLIFTDLQASMGNITNDSLALSKNHFAKLEASTKIMGKGLITADFNFDLRDTNNRFVGDAHIEKFDATLLNQYLEPTAYVRIRKGNISQGDVHFFADDEVGAGRMKLLYKNLHVDFLNQKDPSKNNKMGLLMKSFFANRVVNTKNPHYLITKKGDVFYRRDSARSIFHYWGNIAMSGVASSAGVTSNKKELKKLKKEIKELNKEALRKEKAIRRREEEEAEEAAKKKKS